MPASSIYIFLSISANSRWPQIAQIVIPDSFLVGWGDKSDQWTTPGLNTLSVFICRVIFYFGQLTCIM